jgi:hypothetical protein
MPGRLGSIATPKHKLPSTLARDEYRPPPRRARSVSDDPDAFDAPGALSFPISQQNVPPRRYTRREVARREGAVTTAQRH